jgi:hypothetical protein
VPCPYSDPNWVSPVSACASKWISEGDGVVAAQDDGDRARRRDREHGGLEPPQRFLGVPGWHQHVAGVRHAQVGQRVHAEREVRPGPVVRQVVGGPDRLRAEPGSRPVRGAAVERRADEHDIKSEPVERTEFGPRHPEERDVGPVHASDHAVRTLQIVRH